MKKRLGGFRAVKGQSRATGTEKRFGDGFPVV